MPFLGTEVDREGNFALLPHQISRRIITLIRITKAERATIYKLFPDLRVPRTATGKYWLCEEEKYLRAIPNNKDAAALLDVIDRRRARLAALAKEANA
nr:MAG TPA: hypothetical protein [Caudoviricetes sp.]